MYYKTLYRSLVILFVFEFLPSSACIDKNPKLFIGSFLHRILTPNNNSVFSRKQWALTAGAIGTASVVSWCMWKYCGGKRKISNPIEEKKEAKANMSGPRQLKFNAANQLALYYKFRSNENVRRVWDECFNEYVKRNEVDFVQDCKDIKKLLYYIPKDFFRLTKDNQNNPDEQTWFYEAKRQDGASCGLMTTIQNGKVIKLSTYKIGPSNEGNIRVKIPIFCYNSQTILLLNQVIQKLDKK